MKKILLILSLLVFTTMSFTNVERKENVAEYWKVVLWEESFWTEQEAITAKNNKITWCNNHNFEVISSGVTPESIPPFPNIYTANVIYGDIPNVQ